MACHQRLGTAHTEERRRAWHDIITFGQHTRWKYIGRGMPSSPLASTKRSNDDGRGMPSSPLGSTHGRMTSGVAYHHRLWAAHTVERRRAGHAIVAHGRQTRSNDVRRDMPSPPLENAHSRTTSAWHAILPLGSTHGRTTSGVACHHSPWTTNNV